MSSPPILAPGIWPRTLPLPDRDSYGYSSEFGLMRTEFTGGFKRQRRTAWGQPTIFQLGFRMNVLQLSIFHAFLEAYGYGFFKMDLVMGGAHFVQAGKDCVEAQVRFTSDPQVNMIGINLFRVSIMAEIRSMMNPAQTPITS